jgi:hypothetical protein
MHVCALNLTLGKFKSSFEKVLSLGSMLNAGFAARPVAELATSSGQSRVLSFLYHSSEDIVHHAYPGIYTQSAMGSSLAPAVPRSRQIHPQGVPTHTHPTVTSSQNII